LKSLKLLNTEMITVNSNHVSCRHTHDLGSNWLMESQENFVDTKGVIRIRRSKKNRQHNGQNKNYKGTNNDLQNIHIKLKIK